ncbi:MAG TPA: YdeI/OmpD-associated family protein [Phototrophicaceae bacterium]|nr:YdeI/OmpD-associated family protein [Phototrophicaceae bacterium]
MDVTFFVSESEFHQWLSQNHAQVTELWVGFYKKKTGEPSITYPEALDEALCFGWIDGLRKTIDEASYKIRFTPRKVGSLWSRVNTNRVEELLKQGRMQPAGIKAYEARQHDPARYSYEENERKLDTRYEEQFRTHAEAWAFFQSQPPSYQKTANWWVMSAKQETTRQNHLKMLIDASANGERLANIIYKRKAE